jgi:hypothetical protein
MFRWSLAAAGKDLANRALRIADEPTLFCHPNNTLMQSRATNEGKPFTSTGAQPTVYVEPASVAEVSLRQMLQ